MVTSNCVLLHPFIYIYNFYSKDDYSILSGLDKCCGASLQFRRHRFWLDDMLRELQQIPQHDFSRHRRRFGHKCLQQSTGWNLFIRHNRQYSVGAKHVRRRCPD